MKELTLNDIRAVSGGNGKDVAQLAGGVAGTYLSGGNAYVGMGSAYVAGEIYSGIRNGYTTAPGVSGGLGSFNPNYNPGLMGGWRPGMAPPHSPMCTWGPGNPGSKSGCN